jgi:hypothetical protein
MVARRENFHRVYELTERVAPEVLAAEANAAPPSDSQVQVVWIEKAVTALGITQARWIHDYFTSSPSQGCGPRHALVLEGTLLRVAVEGWDVPGYVHRSQQALLKKAARGALQALHTTLLSPFDPVVWDRERATGLFDFDYRLECYTPEPKRVHGYFVLPILCRGELIGRLDAKAHRAEGVFEVKALYAQPGCKWSEEQVHDVAQAIRQCAAWHDTPQVRITATRPVGLKAALSRAIKSQIGC